MSCSWRIRLVDTIYAHEDRVWDVDISPDGSLLVTSSADQSARVWWWSPSSSSTLCSPCTNSSSVGSSSSRLCCTLADVHTRTVRCARFAPGSSSRRALLACGSFDATCSVWRLRASSVTSSSAEKTNGGETVSMRSECVSVLEGHEHEVKSVAWDDSASFLATCSRDKSVWIWENLGSTVSNDGEKQMCSRVSRNDGMRGDSMDGENDDDFECASVLTAHTQDVKRVRFRPATSDLVSCSYDDTIRIWRYYEDDWESVQVLRGHTSTVWDAAFELVDESRWMVSVGDDRCVVLWYERRSSDGEPTNSQNVAREWVECTRLRDVSERALYSCAWCVHPVKDAQKIATFHSMIAVVGGDDAIRVFEVSSSDSDVERSEANAKLSLLATYPGAHSTDINCVVWHPVQADTFATASDDGTVRIWQIYDAGND